MQMKALRSANFAKLSSSSSTSEAYWVTSISAGTPAGYCLSQIRSMDFSLRPFPPVAAGCLAGIADFETDIGQSGRPWQAAGHGAGVAADRRRPIRLESEPVVLTGRLVVAAGILWGGLGGRLGGRLRPGGLGRGLIGGFRRGVRFGVGMPDGLGILGRRRLGT